MKLALAHEKGIEILSASGAIASHDARVLRAGITKILKTGKNRIVLELERGQDLSTEAIREITEFDAMARELSGRLVLAGVGAPLKTKIESFARPPVILCFPTREQALAFFSAQAAAAAGSHPAQRPAPEPQAAPAQSEARDAEVDGLRAEERALQARLHALQRENQRLKEMVVQATIARRQPAHEAEYLERIRELETQLEQAWTEASASKSAAPAKT